MSGKQAFIPMFERKDYILRQIEDLCTLVVKLLNLSITNDREQIELTFDQCLNVVDLEDMKSLREIEPDIVISRLSDVRLALSFMEALSIYLSVKNDDYLERLKQALSEYLNSKNVCLFDSFRHAEK